MADELLRSRHAFGNSENVDAALESKKFDEFDILFLDGESSRPTVGWIDKNGNKVILDYAQIIRSDELPESGSDDVLYIVNSKPYYWDGTQFVPLFSEGGVDEATVDIKVSQGVSDANAHTDDQIEMVEQSYEKIKYEISSKPKGTLVDYREKEIRVMCPENTEWVKQNVGSTGNANMYYMGFKAYAPDGAVGFKEGDQGVIEDEMFDFTGDFAGTDEFGRNYSIVWLALASYDPDTDTWSYFGKNSTSQRYIGWTYVVEWYDAEGIVIEADSIRINLSNEECHTSIEPYYMGDAVSSDEVDSKCTQAVTESKTYTDEQIAAIMSAMTVVEF